CVKSPIWTRIPYLPVELFGGDLDHYICLRHLHFHFIPSGFAGKSEPEKHRSWDDRPENFESCVAMRIDSTAPLLVAIFNQEDEHQRGHQEEGSGRDVIDKIKERIDARSIGRDVFWKPPEHESAMILFAVERLLNLILKGEMVARGGSFI